MYEEKADVDFMGEREASLVYFFNFNNLTNLFIYFFHFLLITVLRIKLTKRNKYSIGVIKKKPRRRSNFR